MKSIMVKDKELLQQSMANTWPILNTTDVKNQV